jgi:hypothetical protein
VRLRSRSPGFLAGTDGGEFERCSTIDAEGDRGRSCRTPLLAALLLVTLGAGAVPAPVLGDGDRGSWRFVRIPGAGRCRQLPGLPRNGPGSALRPGRRAGDPCRIRDGPADRRDGRIHRSLADPDGIEGRRAAVRCRRCPRIRPVPRTEHPSASRTVPAADRSSERASPRVIRRREAASYCGPRWGRGVRAVHRRDRLSPSPYGRRSRTRTATVGPTSRMWSGSSTTSDFVFSPTAPHSLSHRDRLSSYPPPSRI